jgi:hypothetical protein
MYSVMALIAKIGLCMWVMACLHGSTYLEDADDIPTPALLFEGEENALSVIQNSKSNSKQSSPRRD